MGVGRAIAATVAGVALLVVGCDLRTKKGTEGFQPVSVDVPAVGPGGDDDDHLAWAEQEPWAVVIRKSCRTLDVYRSGRRVRSYSAVFGMNGFGSKLYQGDLRTPTGLYTIVDKRPHPRWEYFLLLDYPNLEDLRRYRKALQAGDIPKRGGSYADVGSEIGIHGTDKPDLNERNVDWTWGCISLKNPDVKDLVRLVPLGTLVLIEN